MLLTRVLLVIVLGCGLAAAQSSQSSIAGTVTDAQGGVIAGAEVIATHVQTNQQFKATTSTEGTYVLPSLPVGVYDFTATAAGFKKLQRSGIMVEVTQRLRVDLGLEVGQVTESVTVKSDVVRIQTEDSTLSTVVENRQIEDLPLNGRNIFSLMTMVAGAVPRLRAVDGFADADTASGSMADRRAAIRCTWTARRICTT
ncbi:MAG: TonB-dependent Receptor Plug Domain protein [Candidatus Solibacter sp.]|nr:TonB-dependent Receptor Plug Domain protein [Candidatus Solibacter sp.]